MASERTASILFKTGAVMLGAGLSLILGALLWGRLGVFAVVPAVVLSGTLVPALWGVGARALEKAKSARRKALHAFWVRKVEPNSSALRLLERESADLLRDVCLSIVIDADFPEGLRRDALRTYLDTLTGGWDTYGMGPGRVVLPAEERKQLQSANLGEIGIDVDKILNAFD